MRKITSQAVYAFYNSEKFSLSNTVVTTRVDWTNTINEMFLHWNLIAKFVIWLNNKLYISSAGWESKTTKERLNGILYDINYSIKQKNFVWYILNHITGELSPFDGFDDGYLKTF